MPYFARTRTVLFAILLGGAAAGVAHGSVLPSSGAVEPIRLEHSAAHIANDAFPAIAIGLNAQLVVELGGRFGSTVDLRSARCADGRASVCSSSDRRTLFTEPQARLLRAGICTAALGTPPPQF